MYLSIGLSWHLHKLARVFCLVPNASHLIMSQLSFFTFFGVPRGVQRGKVEDAQCICSYLHLFDSLNHFRSPAACWVICTLLHRIANFAMFIVSTWCFQHLSLSLFSSYLPSSLSLCLLPLAKKLFHLHKDMTAWFAYYSTKEQKTRRQNVWRIEWVSERERER